MGKPLSRSSLYFVSPGHVEVVEELVPVLTPDQVLIETLYSSISSGTELLVYNNQIPQDQPLDTTIPSLSQNPHYPFKYGYSVVGKVISIGAEVDSSWIGKIVFSFHPHESLFTAHISELVEVPENLSPLDAVFLANMETAVNLVMDGQPILGEKVVVMGQGVVGLLTTSILSRFPLNKLITLDIFPLRRQISQQLGAQMSLDPDSEESFLQIKSLLEDDYSSGADLIYEVTGNPLALSHAIELSGFDGRIVVGSWYGSKPVNLKMGDNFHRGRIKLISSQVSTINPAFLGRWNKVRRLDVAWCMLGNINPSQYVSHYLPLTQASEAYRLLSKNPNDVIQVVFTYQGGEHV